MNEDVKSFPENVELKPWQNELMKYIAPHDREIVWVVGKDGKLSKHNSQRIKVNTANVVMVFSNDAPYTSRLAKDRFRVFNINNNQLENKNIVVNPKEKNESIDSDSDIDSDDLQYNYIVILK